MKFTSVLTVVACAITASAQSTSSFTNFIDCGGKFVQLFLEDFSLAPSPMCIGKDICITAKGELADDIVPGATLEVFGKHLGQVVYSDKIDLCQALAANGQACPVPYTAKSFKICLKLKPTYLQGSATQFDFIASNGDQQTLFCQRALDRAPRLQGINC
ncbi:hypothetical protein BGZ95_007659 [Linnemannia exigua]|uniref:MD-2-related lipid-recognition domain-containing protein n=1 Tax=Linnemannia exigua TaxID=604196 RepID=A0AAD4H7Q3_9FUNG|nr:hypothetical protein BGZ95_007659 [Linnemannia exigua]